MSERHRVLVGYSSKHGSTAEIAQAIATALRVAGLEVDVERARRVRSLEPYGAVVLGSAVYAGRWRGDAMRLLRRPALREREVWLFSSGPVGEDEDDLKDRERWTRPPQVERRASALGVHGHAVFGGKIAEDRGFIRKRMARKIPPELRDRRDWDEIEAWARSIAATLTSRSVTAGRESGERYP